MNPLLKNLKPKKSNPKDEDMAAWFIGDAFRQGYEDGLKNKSKNKLFTAKSPDELKEAYLAGYKKGKHMNPKTRKNSTVRINPFRERLTEGLNVDNFEDEYDMAGFNDAHNMDAEYSDEIPDVKNRLQYLISYVHEAERLKRNNKGTPLGYYTSRMALRELKKSIKELEESAERNRFNPSKPKLPDIPEDDLNPHQDRRPLSTEHIEDYDYLKHEAYLAGKKAGKTAKRTGNKPTLSGRTLKLFQQFPFSFRTGYGDTIQNPQAIKSGDDIEINVKGKIYRGTVITAADYSEGDLPNWYIEFYREDGNYAYWKQGVDGGTVKVISKKGNPRRHWPKIKKGRPPGGPPGGYWWIFDLFNERGRLIVTRIEKMPKEEGTRRGKTLVGTKHNGTEIARVMLSGPYDTKPNKKTVRK